MTVTGKNIFILFAYALVVLMLFPLVNYCQSDTLRLNEVVVSPRFNDFSVTQNIRGIDTFLLRTGSSGNIGQLLQNENGIFIKSYGPSSIATTSIRGGNAAQTAVTWNGLNIRNPMLGETDLSILSAYLTDDVELQYGGSTAMWGSGSVAGTIHLKNKIHFNSGTDVSAYLGFGSYLNNVMALSAGYSDKKISTSTRFIQRKGKNNYLYNGSDGSRLTLQHSDFFQYGILHEDHFKIKKNQLLSFRYWAQVCDRLIPPLLDQQFSKAYQHDDFNRAMLDWRIELNNVTIAVRNGFFYENINYNDTLISLFSLSSSITNSSEAEIFYSLNSSSKFNAGINNTWCSGRSDGYLNGVSQNFASVFAGYLWQSKNNKHVITLNIREEFTLNKFQSPTASAAFSSKLFAWMQIKGSVNKLYRLPTFNNLYWQPGGNRNLLPENGISEDLSLLLSRDRQLNETTTISFNSQVSLFNRVVNNWIIWLPGSSGIWTPQNLLHVWSRGMESNSSVVIKSKNFSVKFYVITNYILSTNQKKKNENDASIGRQLIYTPMYSGSGGLQIKWKNLFFSFSQTYTGYRYITADNYEYLDPYTLGNLVLGFTRTFKNYRADFSFCINNVFNEDYMVMAQRPMPPANYMLNLKLYYHNSNKK